jgi:predicted metal-binding membrane protein
MNDRPTLEGLLARPNLGVGAALVLLSALAWLELATGMTHPALAWQAADVGAAFLMWLTMAVAMMLPTAAPAILAFADLGRGAGQAGRAAHSAGRLGAFVGGYLMAWWAFGVLATAAQWALAVTARGMPGLAAGGSVAGTLLLVAGLYQFSSLKDLCLTRCRSPLAFFLAHWREGTRGALYLGLRHGAHCVGCCWALMALMLGVGTMSLGWTAALTALMLAEKVLPGGRLVGRAVGLALIAWGGVLLVPA